MKSRASIIETLKPPCRKAKSGDEGNKRLTSQELECLRWCKEGKTNWEIGEILTISEKTVEFHLSNSMRKLGASNRITAVIMGIKEGFIPL
jgi:DNA-binding CsgD family transcriptional regulator